MPENKNVELMRGEPEIAVRKLAIPIMISMLLTASYNIVDGIFVAGLGQAAIAGIGFVTPIFMIINGISVGLGNGATSSISRFLGAKNKEGVNQSASHALLIFLMASILVPVVLFFIQEPLLSSYGASGQSLVEAIKYGTPLYLGSFTFMFANGGSGILRGEGDMKRAMIAMIVSVILNTVLDPVFIYFLGFGSAGASLATIVSSLGSAVVIMYWILVKKDTYVDVNLKEFKYDGKMVTDILKVGIPASMDILMMSIATSLYLVFISTVGGDYGIATFTSGQRLYTFALMPLSAIGAAVAAVTGSAFGARNGDYLSRTHMFGVKFGAVFGAVLMAIILIFSSQLAYLFAYTPETAQLIPGITEYLRIVCLCIPFSAIGGVSALFYQGLGRGTTSLAWTIIREIIFTVGGTYLLGIYLGWGIVGIWIGMALGRAIACLLSFVYARYTIRGLKEEFANS